MAYKQNSPQVVAEGGTGVTSNTAYAVLCGGTTGSAAIQSIAGIGSSGQFLTSNGAGALPTFQDPPGDVSGPVSSTDNALARWDGTGGDTLQNSTVIVTDNGEMTNASQPAFYGYIPSGVNNLTGDGTVVILGDSDVSAGMTELYDQNADFTPSASGGGFFTAPVTGKYLLSSMIGFAAVSSSAFDEGECRIVASNRGVRCDRHPFNLAWNGTFSSTSLSAIIDMDASDTVTNGGSVGGSGKTVDLAGVSGVQYRSVFFGALIC